MSSKLLFLLPILALLVSGCAMPGGISIPGMGFLGGETAYENDVVIIRNLEAFPTRATTDQPITVVAYVQNIGEEDFTTTNPVTVILYDYCNGLFQEEKIQTKCPGATAKTGKDTTCDGIALLSQETKAVEWTLPPSKIELLTPCELKVLVGYNYTTTSISSISFISEGEYKRQLQEGKFTQKGSSRTLGRGPLKASWEVETPQPITAKNEGNVALLLRLENRGSGFIQTKTDPAKKLEYNFEIVENGLAGANLQPIAGECQATKGTKDKLIMKRRELPCQVKMKTNFQTEVKKELTKQLKVVIKYDYEFRAQRRIEVVPPAGR